MRGGAGPRVFPWPRPEESAGGPIRIGGASCRRGVWDGPHLGFSGVVDTVGGLEPCFICEGAGGQTDFDKAERPPPRGWMQPRQNLHLEPPGWPRAGTLKLSCPQGPGSQSRWPRTRRAWGRGQGTWLWALGQSPVFSEPLSLD